MKNKRKICIVTGSRAEYGLLYWLIKYISDDSSLELQIIATGMHLSSKFGSTYKQIEKDGFTINSKIDVSIDSDKSEGILNSMALGLTKFPHHYKKLSPDLIVILGDRFEIFTAAISAMMYRIPIAHIHGGEKTEGAFDEPMRHSITKMSHFHFVANEEYKNRVIQLGENPKNVYCVGGLGIDNILKLKLLSKKELELDLGLKFDKKNLLITFHPVTLESNTSEKHMNELLLALDNLVDTTLIFTMPNADTDGNIIFKLITDFVSGRDNAVAYISLGQLRYLSCLKYIDGVIGNSSSGLIEVPAFKKPTINIGDRQRGRIMAKSVINCDPEKEIILDSIKKMYSSSFKNNLKNLINPYGNGGASYKIFKMIKSIDISRDLIKKEFYDLD